MCSRIHVMSIMFLFLCCSSLVGCGGPPQMGADAETFKAVDAFYTAVSLREPETCDRCEQRLHTLHEQGKLPDAAARTLGEIEAQVHAGKWQEAQARLGDFMRGQRRNR